MKRTSTQLKVLFKRSMHASGDHTEFKTMALCTNIIVVASIESTGKKNSITTTLGPEGRP